MHGSRTYLDEINSRVGFKRGVAQASAVNFAQAAEYYDVLARPLALHVFIFFVIYDMISPLVTSGRRFKIFSFYSDWIDKNSKFQSLMKKHGFGY